MLSKRILIPAFLIALGNLCLPLGAQTIQWLNMGQLEAKQKVAKKKVMIDVYTSWCGWCKTMDRTTFSNPSVVNIINSNYYPVKFNAEQLDNITFRGKEYRFRREGKTGYHELAASLLNGRMGYPTVIFLSEDLDLIQPIQGYQDADNFEKIIMYFSCNFHKSMPWEKFLAAYQKGMTCNMLQK